MNHRNILWEAELIFLLHVFLHLKSNEKNIILVNKLLACLFLPIHREYNNYVFIIWFRTIFSFIMVIPCFLINHTCQKINKEDPLFWPQNIHFNKQLKRNLGRNDVQIKKAITLSLIRSINNSLFLSRQ